MGQVWHARDVKLDRGVAIKVLQDAWADDPAWLARFDREARLLAALTHPNIATVHGLDEFEGLRYLVMELVPGQTLAKRLMGGALPLDEALQVGRQIAEALEAAHDRGIIHRDLKPANVILTPEGKVKVLDFGLAKSTQQHSPPADKAADTIGQYEGQTEEGVILGTPAYMAPEQGRGRPVDRRCDIWALGCVLFEALSGQKVFSGLTFQDTLAAVIENSPDWKSLPAGVPPRVTQPAPPLPPERPTAASPRRRGCPAGAGGLARGACRGAFDFDRDIRGRVCMQTPSNRRAAAPVAVVARAGSGSRHAGRVCAGEVGLAPRPLTPTGGPCPGSLVRAIPASG